ncbi:uncharacterized protein BXZ73DRAFT_102809 [Epithele typhae]|uniref:uncharacterized protein n=1 Tax=Epithele typhae TaxID=378194 RepID=UPI002007483B|nr:uncharacterized protein BXZ73DRAFT_102809 [Epithele typhae]KAH9926546.1 hypothetical protein BXZ73DRAFT_102809 [Epithele typhae]
MPGIVNTGWDPWIGTESYSGCKATQVTKRRVFFPAVAHLPRDATPTPVSTPYTGIQFAEDNPSLSAHTGRNVTKPPGPYMEILLFWMCGPLGQCPDGTAVFTAPMVALQDLGFFARYALGHRSGRDLEVASAPSAGRSSRRRTRA